MVTLVRYRVGDVPVLSARPSPDESNGRLAMWLHFLGGTKESIQPSLECLAGHGWTAVSLDAWRHGERATGPTGRDLMTDVLGHFRAMMWPVLGHTVLDALR